MTTRDNESAVRLIMMDLTRQQDERAEAYLEQSVGAQDFEMLHQGLRFRVMANPQGATHVVIGRLGGGTYTIGCETRSDEPGGARVRIHQELRDISGDQLRSAFEQVTNLTLP